MTCSGKGSRPPLRRGPSCLAFFRGAGEHALLASSQCDRQAENNNAHSCTILWGASGIGSRYGLRCRRPSRLGEETTLLAEVAADPAEPLEVGARDIPFFL